MRRRLLAGLAIALLAVILASVWIFSSERGLLLVYKSLQPVLPAGFEVESLRGSLIGPIYLNGVNYVDDTTTLEIDLLNLDWSPLGLLGGNLHVTSVAMEGIQLRTASTTNAEEGAFAMPSLVIPIEFTVDEISVSNAAWKNDDRITVISAIQASIAASQQQLDINLAIRQSEQLELNLQGAIQVGSQFAHELGFDWVAAVTPQQELSGRGQLTGTLQQTNLIQQTTGYLDTAVDLNFENPLEDLRWQGDLQVNNVDLSQLTDQAADLRGGLRIAGTGDLQSAQLNGAIDLQQSPLGPMVTTFDLAEVRVNESGNGLLVDQLVMQWLENSIAINGNLNWSPLVAWQLQVGIQNLNPGTIDAGWPGAIKGNLVLDGVLQNNSPQLSVSVAELGGDLRGYPVALQGQVAWLNNETRVDEVILSSGDTRIGLSGSVATTTELQWYLQSADLQELLPGLSGSANAQGQLQGVLDDAQLEANLQAGEIRFQDYSADNIVGSLAARLNLLELSDTDWSALQVSASADEVVVKQQFFQTIELASDGRRLELSASATDGFASFALEGAWREDRWQGQLAEASLQHPEFGQWLLLAPADLELSLDGLALSEACLENPDSGDLCLDTTVNAGRSSTSFNLEALPLHFLKIWFPESFTIAGNSSAAGQIDYDAAQGISGNVDVNLTPGRIGYRLQGDRAGQIEYESAVLAAVFQPDEVTADFAMMLPAGNSVTGEVNLPDINLNDFDARTQVLRASASVELQSLDLLAAELPEIERLQGQAALQLAITGTLQEPVITGSADLNNASFRVLPPYAMDVDNLQVAVELAQSNIIRHSLSASLAAGELMAQGESVLDPELGLSSQWTFNASGMELLSRLQPWLPPDLSLQGAIDVDGNLMFQTPDQLDTTIDIRVRDGLLSYPLFEDELQEWPVDQLTGRLSYVDRQVDLAAELDIGENQATLALDITDLNIFEFEASDQAVSGQLDLQLDDLSLAGILLPDVQNTKGSLQAELAVSGSLSTPELTATARLADAAVDLSGLGVQLRQINLSANTDNSGLTLLTGSLASADGTLDVNGQFDMTPGTGWPGELVLTGENLEIMNLPEARIVASPDLNITYADRLISVSGTVNIPTAKIQPRDMTSAVRVSNDTVIVGEQSTPPTPLTIQSSVRVNLGDQVDFFGYGFECKLGGSLLVEEQPSQPTRATGEIRIREGRYRAYGQFLNIDNGKLLYTGGIITNPGLDMRAVRETNGVIAGVKVSGRLQSPRLDLFSEPAMGQTDALSYLLTGGPLETATRGEGATMANAALALGLTGGDRIARSLGEQFGIDEMRVENSSTGDQASLVMGRYLSPRLYVGYGVGLIESVNTLEIRYLIDERMQLEAESGEHQGVDLIFGFER